MKKTRSEKEKLVYQWAKNANQQTVASILSITATTKVLDEIIRDYIQK